MVEQFFSDPVSLQRLHLGPLGPRIDAFARHLSDRGYARRTTEEKIRVVSSFSRWLQRRRRAVEDVDEQVVSEFLRYRRRKGPSLHGVPPTLQDLLTHLRTAGIIPCVQIEHSPLYAIEGCFARYLTEERGLAKPTLDNYLPIVRLFLSERFGGGPIALDKVAPKDIARFILRHANRMSPRRAQLVTTGLRSFFRFLYERGTISMDLAASVPSVANWRLSDLPKFLEPEQVERLLKACNRATSEGRRDYAVLLLLARLGLRAGEVVHMELDHLDWENGELMVRGKSVRQDRLPIPKDVGEALAAYIGDGRPRCSSRSVFLRLKAPQQGFTSSVAICDIVRRALERAGLHPERKGSHLLRHSLAVTMLRGGASLAEIGEILRHELPSTTEIYTKVDVATLGALALPWQGGEL
ncbi:MAG: tyrosine-type recombinase/integrase [Syntrophorhabdales bacterium]